MSSLFELKKKHILEQLDVPEDAYSDLSPKGSIDEAIQDLIAEINRLPGLVTTSSCAGRVSVFLEGKKKAETTLSPIENSDSATGAVPALAGPGGKGGGRWLFVSHTPVPILENASSPAHLHSLFGLTPTIADKCAGRSVPCMRQRFVHLKFEPMILHILTASLKEAQIVLAAALQAGFRESGAVGLEPCAEGSISPMVAVRSSGLAFDSIIAFDAENSIDSMVDENYLRVLVNIANERFIINTERIGRFKSALRSHYARDPNGVKSGNKNHGPGWEDSAARRKRKQREGLIHKQALLSQHKSQTELSNTPEDYISNLSTNLDGETDLLFFD